MNPALLKLEVGAVLAPEDRRRFDDLITDVRETGAGEDVVREGDRPERVHVVLEGFACRYKMLPDGGRQIMAWLVPGDFCDLHVTILGEMDHSIGALSPCRIAVIPESKVEALTTANAGLARALWWATLVDEGILREWMVGMGRRPADRQMAHLFCELLARLRTVDLVTDNGFDFPVTQEELADTLGMSPVHVNRVLQQLRADGLIRLAGGRLEVLDEAGLCAFAGFDPNYLHLNRRKR